MGRKSKWSGLNAVNDKQRRGAWLTNNRQKKAQTVARLFALSYKVSVTQLLR